MICYLYIILPNLVHQRPRERLRISFFKLPFCWQNWTASLEFIFNERESRTFPNLVEEASVQQGKCITKTTSYPANFATFGLV